MDISNHIFEVIAYNWKDFCYIKESVLIKLSNADVARILFREGELMCIYWEKEKSMEYLIYNKERENYFVLDKEKILPTANRSCQLFISVCRSQKYIGYIIPKNACSTLISIALLLDHGQWLDEPWYYPEEYNKVLICREDYDGAKFHDYLHYAVYRDPVERFLNYCNYTYTRKDFLVAPYAQPDLTKQEFIGSLITMAGVIAPRRKWEAHLQTQTHYTAMMPRIDWLVDIHDFSDFQQNILKVDKTLRANASQEKTITQENCTEEQLSKIREIYQEDYLLPQIYGDRIYKPGH